MKVNKINNDKLKAALQNRDETIKNMYFYINEEANLDDEQMIKVAKYIKLSQFQKDLLYLTTNYSVAEIADMYQVSTTHIYNTLKKIKKILQ